MITVLTTTTPDALLTKTIRLVNGRWQKQEYARAFMYDVTSVEVHNLVQLSEALTLLETAPTSCVIRGKLKAAMPTEGVLRRKDAAGGHPAFFEENPDGLRWVMLDFDKVPSPPLEDNQARLDFLTAMLPAWFHNVSYHYQWSASAGLDGWQTLSAHLWFWLSEPWRDSALIERIDVENWDVDESTIRTVQPNYTAAPIFLNADDPVPVRSGLVVKQESEVVLPPFQKPPPFVPLGRTKPERISKTFEERLADIGPRYHMPILRAVASYVGTHGQNCDTWLLKERLRDAITHADPGSSPKSLYLTEKYLDHSIQGALRKFCP